MIKNFCDRCGKEFEKKYKKYQKMEMYWPEGDTTEYFDLCEECYSAFKTAFKNWFGKEDDDGDS